MPKLLEERKRGTGAASAVLLESVETPLYPSVDTPKVETQSVGISPMLASFREDVVREVMCVGQSPRTNGRRRKIGIKSP